MEEQFVPYKLALKLKELGFNEKCFGYYADNKLYIHNSKSKNYINLEAPLWQQAFDWFRKKHRLDFKIDYQYDTNKKLGYKPQYFIDIHEIVDTGEILFNKQKFSIIRHESFKTYKTYEEARQTCLEKLIELVNEK